jgi:formamidopyrimidine-DNA glycosylase
MPELPETETIARDLDRAISGTTLTALTVSKPDVLRHVSARELAKRLIGARVLRSWRRAKMIVIDLDNGDHLVVQPRFTGALLIDDGHLPEAERRFSTLALTLDDGRILHYRDIRRLGTVALKGEAEWAKYSASLGIEPLDPAFTASHLSVVLRGSRQAIKKVLMDQRRLAGIGNIYANEALWRARIDPSRAARRVSADGVPALRDAIVSVLDESITARGTSFRDYRDASGARGSFAEQLAVYGRGGLPCSRCGTRLVDTSAIDGRTTVFCPRCQR